MSPLWPLITAFIGFCLLARVEAAVQQRTRAGVLLHHFVPPSSLPEGGCVDILKANYRLVGPQADVNRALENQGVIAQAFTEVYQRARYKLKVSSLRFSQAVPYDTESQVGHKSSICTERDFGHVPESGSCKWVASEFAGVDVTLTVGVTRETLHIHMGSPEWAYSKIVQTILQQRGFDLTVMHMYLDLISTPASIDILKRIPTTAIYAEKTSIQLEGLTGQHASLHPFDSGKQNLLLKVLDSLGLHTSAGCSRVNITAVRHACRFDPGLGHTGLVEVAFVTQRDKPFTLLAEALSAALPKLLDGFAEEGIALKGIRIVESRAAEVYSLQSQIAQALDDSDPIRSFETRLPQKQLPSFGSNRHAGWASYSFPALIGLCLFACSLGALYLWRQQGNKSQSEGLAGASKLPKSDFLRGAQSDQQDGLILSSSYPPAGSQAQDPSRGGSATVLSGQVEASPGLPSPFSEVSQLPFRRSSSSIWSVPCLLGEDSAAHSIRTGKGLQQPSGIPPDSPSRKALSPEDEKRKRSFSKAESIQGWRLKEEEIQICRLGDEDWLLGSGGFGKVYKGLRDGLQDVACKVLNDGDDLQEQQFALEIQLQKSLSFDTNIVHFLGVARHQGRLMLILEYMEGGSLSCALHKPGSKLGWRDQGRHLALDIVRGLAYLHKHSVMHGDLKSQNVLLGRHAAYAKLSDVGLARIISSSVNSQSMNPDCIAGTFAFAAPELILGLNCGPKADIFSLGVLLWEICTLEVPKRGSVRDLRVPEEAPQEIADLIDRCLSFDAKQRPSCQEIFESIKRSIEAEDKS